MRITFAGVHMRQRYPTEIFRPGISRLHSWCRQFLFRGEPSKKSHRSGKLVCDGTTPAKTEAAVDRLVETIPPVSTRVWKINSTTRMRLSGNTCAASATPLKWSGLQVLTLFTSWSAPFAKWNANAGVITILRYGAAIISASPAADFDSWARWLWEFSLINLNLTSRPYWSVSQSCAFSRGYSKERCHLPRCRKQFLVRGCTWRCKLSSYIGGEGAAWFHEIRVWI